MKEKPVHLFKKYSDVDPTVSHIILYFLSLSVILPLLVHVLLNFSHVFS